MCSSFYILVYRFLPEWEFVQLPQSRTQKNISSDKSCTIAWNLQGLVKYNVCWRVYISCKLYKLYVISYSYLDHFVLETFRVLWFMMYVKGCTFHTNCKKLYFISFSYLVHFVTWDYLMTPCSVISVSRPTLSLYSVWYHTKMLETCTAQRILKYV